MELKEEDHFVKNILCDPHHLGGPLKEGEERIVAAKELFVDANVLVSRCCWRDSEERLEAEYFLGYFETLKEVVDKMKESYMNFLSDRNHLLEVTKIYHHALRREEYEEKRLVNDLGDAYVSLERTQKTLQE